jgi:hypothetical protein
MRSFINNVKISNFQEIINTILNTAIINFKSDSNRYVNTIMEILEKKKYTNISQFNPFNNLFSLYFNPKSFNAELKDNVITFKNEKDIKEIVCILQDSGLIWFKSPTECLLPDYFMIQAIKGKVEFIDSEIIDLLISCIDAMKLFGNIKGKVLEIIIGLLISDKNSETSKLILETIRNKIKIIKNGKKENIILGTNNQIKLFSSRNDQFNDIEKGFISIVQDSQSPVILENENEETKFANEPLDILIPILDKNLSQNNDIEEMLYPTSIQVTCAKSKSFLNNKCSKFFEKMDKISKNKNDILHDCLAIFISIFDFDLINKDETWFYEIKNDSIKNCLKNDLGKDIVDILNTQKVDETLEFFFHFLYKKKLVAKNYNFAYINGKTNNNYESPIKKTTNNNRKQSLDKNIIDKLNFSKKRKEVDEDDLEYENLKKMKLNKGNSKKINLFKKILF